MPELSIMDSSQSSTAAQAAIAIVGGSSPFLSVQHQIAPYQKYIIHTFYTWDTGDIQLPVARGSLSASIAQTHAAFGQKVVVIQAQRLNLPPEFPSPVSTDPNVILKTAIIDTVSPSIIPDMQGRVFSMQATYTYLLKQPIWVAGGGVQAPINPADGYSRNNYTLSSSQFVQGLI